ncbi:hypothetical protein BGZ63DRAFT_360969 [Mariannaea sp. PMI_226]|nr:hypothetical protein BGZ63DRAFT_360969 [Mariannaea sp. PMI_226]
MRSLLARITGTPRARATIRPASDHVFLSGYGEEARGQYLWGKVVLFLPKGEGIKGVRLKMTGRITMGDHLASACTSTLWETSDFVLHEWEPFLTQGRAGEPSAHGSNYEWPFELLIRGNQEESFRGCGRCAITYRLEAAILKEDGSEDFQDYVPIRIIRCPQESSYELMDPVTAQGSWCEKIAYSISLRHQAIALGGLIPIDAQITRIQHGATIMGAMFYLREHHKIHDKSITGPLIYQGQKIVSRWQLDLENRDGETQNWKLCLPLPKVVRECSPDFAVSGISVDHTLHFAATLLGEDGTVSEYEISMPIILFTSPELPVNGWGIFLKNKEKSASGTRNVLSEGIQIPPKYCKGDFLNDYNAIPTSPPPAYSLC